MSPTIQERIAEALERAEDSVLSITNEHVFRSGWDGSFTPAAAELAGVIEGIVREAQAEALRETANEWTRGQWADAPRRPDRVQERIATAQHVGDWLRARADRIEKGEGA